MKRENSRVCAVCECKRVRRGGTARLQKNLTNNCKREWNKSVRGHPTSIRTLMSKWNKLCTTLTAQRSLRDTTLPHYRRYRTQIIHRLAGKFGAKLHLAVWLSIFTTTKGIFSYSHIICMHGDPMNQGVLDPYTLAKLATCYCILHFGY